MRSLGLAGLVVFPCVGCRTIRPAHGWAEPTRFASAAEGPHRVGHAPGTCDLCDLFYRSRDFVVRIRTDEGLGAGVVVAPKGLIITNAHVVGDDAAPLVETYGGESFGAQVLGTDTDVDLALMKVDHEPAEWAATPLRYGGLPPVGTDVYVIGHPMGLGWTVTRGIVSAVRATGDVAKTAVIQTDAAISPGNSGGPMLDRDGEVLGVVVSKLSGAGVEGMAFAIPASVASDFVRRVERRTP